jgi:hypothetical protein
MYMYVKVGYRKRTADVVIKPTSNPSIGAKVYYEWFSEIRG